MYESKIIIRELWDVAGYSAVDVMGVVVVLEVLVISVHSDLEGRAQQEVTVVSKPSKDCEEDVYKRQSLHSSFMNREVNLGSRSLITLEGRLNRGNICRRYRSATPSPVMVSLHGMNTCLLYTSRCV